MRVSVIASVPTVYQRSTINHAEKWSARQDLHLRSLGPRPSMLLLHYALVAPANTESAGDLVSCGNGKSRSLERVSVGDWRTRRELHPQPSRRQRGALLIELRVRNGGKRW